MEALDRVGDMLIPHSRPLIDQGDIKAVSDVLATGMVAQGKKVKEFENALAEFVGTKYAAAVSSGTSALHMALLGLGVGPGDEVIIPSYVCSSPYFATVQTGAIPRIVDIDPEDMNICAATAKNSISPKTKAIIAPHMFGNPAEIDDLLDLGIPVIEDCAQSLGAKYKKQQVGSFGAISVLSFYATKMISTGEGGMVLTDEPDFFERVLDLRDYDKKALKPTKYNYKMTDFQAALGLSQFSKLQKFIQRRRRIAAIYSEAFSNLECKLPCESANKTSVFFRYVIALDGMIAVQKIAKRRGIICEKPVSTPLHNYCSLIECPLTEGVQERALSIPLYPRLTEEEINYVVDTLRQVLKNNRLSRRGEPEHAEHET